MKAMVSILVALIMAVSFVPQALAVALSTTNPEYSVAVATTQTGVNQWRFDYTVTNHEDTGLNYWTDGRNYYGFSQGFSIFHIEIPGSAVVVSSTKPAPYSPYFDSQWGDYRVTDLNTFLYNTDGSVGNATENPLNSGNDWYLYAAGGWGAPYPKEIPVGFSLELGNITIGITDATLTSFWGFDSDGDGDSPIFTYTPAIPDTYYSMYSTTVIGAVALQTDTPALVPEPSTILLLGSGLAGLAVARRRKCFRDVHEKYKLLCLTR